ncbi:MAG: hypothetical protein FWG45_07780 [Oscillospiraceae bacterium]|nr:hypothetical protein [Oscillospiraceae bacterium]
MLGLVKPGWQSNNESKAVRAVERVTNEETLAQIACDEKVIHRLKVGMMIVAKLADQSLLAEIAKNGGESVVSKAAAEKLVEQEVLLDVAKNSRYSSAKIAAAEKLADKSLTQEMYANIARDMTDIYGQLEVAPKLEDTKLAQDTYDMLAKNKFVDVKVRAKAIMSLTSVKKLTKISEGSEKKYVVDDVDLREVARDKIKELSQA